MCSQKLNYIEGALMKTRSTTTKARFDDLFSRLLRTVAEEQDIRSNGEAFASRIEVRDRLHALRSDLAAIRGRLAAEASALLHDRQPPRYAI
jgi:hypothetical protein